jgi:hypothetical protein
VQTLFYPRPIRAPYVLWDLIMAGSRQDVHLPIFKGGRSGLGSICASACPTFSPVCQQRGQKKHFTAFNVACCGCLSRTAGHSPPSSVGDPQGQQSSFTMLDEPAFGQERLAISGTNHSPPIILLCQAACRNSIFGLKSAVSRQQSAAALLWGCKFPISCNEVLHPLLMTLQ